MSKNWWLYSEDIEEAVSSQWRRIKSAKTDHELAIEASVLTYIGQYKECEHLIVENKLCRFVEARQALFRARRARASVETWSSLIGEKDQMRKLDQIINKGIIDGYAVCVSLVGGIGDQIESASIVLSEENNYMKGERPKLMMRARGANNKIVEDYLYKTRSKHLLARKNDKFIIEIPMPMYRTWLESKGKKITGYKFLRIKAGKQNTRGKKNVLICLKSKANRSNPLSYFGRSLKFQEIIETIEKLKSINECRIKDISEYTNNEKQIIERTHPEIELIRDSVTSLEDTYKYIEEADCVLTVDTSIAHISATSGARTNLLLSKYPDERWDELTTIEEAYKQTINIIQQQEYGKWKGIQEKSYQVVARLTG